MAEPTSPLTADRPGEPRLAGAGRRLPGGRRARRGRGARLGRRRDDEIPTAHGVGDTHTVGYGTEADAILCGWHAIDSTSSKAMALEV